MLQSVSFAVVHKAPREAREGSGYRSRCWSERTTTATPANHDRQVPASVGPVDQRACRHVANESGWHCQGRPFGLRHHRAVSPKAQVVPAVMTFHLRRATPDDRSCAHPHPSSDFERKGPRRARENGQTVEDRAAGVADPYTGSTDQNEKRRAKAPVNPLSYTAQGQALTKACHEKQNKFERRDDGNSSAPLEGLRSSP
jgi:hypothetical protein